MNYKITRILIIFIFIDVIWFTCIDRLYFEESCPDCYWCRKVNVYRILGFAVHEDENVSKPLIYRISEYLGTSCKHPHLTRITLCRWVGLCVPSRITREESFSPSDDFLGAKYFKDENDLTEKLHSVSQRNPSIGVLFQRQVLINHNWDYLIRFMQEIENNQLTPIATNIGNLTDIEKREIVDRIADITWFDWHDQKQSDEHASLILILDREAIPYLLEKIIDQQPSKWLVWTTVGDVAHILLSHIEGRSWPSDEFMTERGISYGGMRGFIEYHQKYLIKLDPQKRLEEYQKLQDTWKSCIKAENIQ